ncbi:GNAT family N-acetyltransferase [Actinoplanes sp. NPDC051470]|uniref:GNAT family N-acetyltransferase n=1 Tax=Actinoplanes sp. NPDC051470 TaxID=3157224 RepID=UPI00342A163B
MAIEVSVRRAAQEDLAGVVRLLAQLAPTWTREQAGSAATSREKQVWEAMVVDERRIVLVAEHGGGVIGIADLVVLTSLLDGAAPHGLLDNMVVDAAHRGQGAGTMLIRAVRAAAQHVGCCRLELLSSKERDRAHAFYQAAGFEQTAEGFRADFSSSSATPARS